jgi:hypothetical protein
MYHTREHSQKGRTQYGWPPCTNLQIIVINFYQDVMANTYSDFFLWQKGRFSCNSQTILWKLAYPEAVFLVVCDPSVNEVWATLAHRDLCIDLSRLLTAHSLKGHTQLKIQPLKNMGRKFGSVCGLYSQHFIFFVTYEWAK